MSKFIETSGNAHSTSPEENATTHSKEQRHKIADNNRALLNFLVKKLNGQCQSYNNELDVKDKINILNIEDEIPKNLIPKPKPRHPLTMEKQGIYPPWIDEITPVVIELLTNKRTLQTNANEKVFDIPTVIDINTQENQETNVTNNRALLDFLVDKLSTQGKPCNNIIDVKDEINTFSMYDEIPMHLLPKPKKRHPLTMERQGIYPPWIEEMSPLVLKLLTKKSIDRTHAIYKNDKIETLRNNIDSGKYFYFIHCSLEKKSNDLSHIFCNEKKNRQWCKKMKMSTMLKKMNMV